MGIENLKRKINNNASVEMEIIDSPETDLDILDKPNLENCQYLLRTTKIRRLKSIYFYFGLGLGLDGF